MESESHPMWNECSEGHPMWNEWIKKAIKNEMNGLREPSYVE